MKSSKQITPIVALLASCLALCVPTVVSASEVDSSIAACLNAWGDHPFGKNPQFKTVDTSVTVLGIGRMPADTEPTTSPSLVLIYPTVNVLGGSTIELMNPNGWYCMRTTVSIIGGVHIRAHCKAHLAATSAGITAVGNNVENRNIRDITVTAVGSVSVERPCS